MPQTFIGCDLARGWIDTHSLPSGATARIKNTPDAIIRWATSLPEDALVVFEATSGCDGPLIATLSRRGLAYARVNPRQAREFTRAIGVQAKTDRVDARILAQMGEKLDLTPTVPRSPARVRLSDLLRRRRQLVEMRKAEKIRRQNAGSADIRAEIDRMIRILDRRVETMDRTIADLISSDPGLERQAALLRAVPRIGPTVLAVLLGELPELGRLDRRRIASLAGLAPRAQGSETWRGSRRIWGGRGRVREAL